jgi:hypothetical protein
MDHRSPILGLIVLCLCTATPAAAQDKRALIEKLMEVLCLCTATPAAAQDKRALIEKLMEVSNISGQLQSGTQVLAAQIMTRIKKSNPTIPDDVSAYVEKKVQAQISRILSTAIDQIGYPIWSETFPADELQSIINFYSSEVGQKACDEITDIDPANNYSCT